jgi:hypothetical protein
MDGWIMWELTCTADVYACRGSKGTSDIIITEVSCAVPSSNMIHLKERRGETTGQLATQSAPRVPWSNRSALVPENLQIPVAKVRNALRKKADPSIKRSPQAAKLKENVKVSPQYLCVQVAVLVLRCKNWILCALVPPDLLRKQPNFLTIVNYVF